MEALRTTGLTLVTDVPPEHEALLKPISRIGHLRETNFGRVFDVKSKPEADSAAYTSVNLPPHTDLPTRELQPGVQFLHCLVNDATGGESVFVDGFAIGEALRREDAVGFPHPHHDADGVLEPRFPHRLSLGRADPGAGRARRDRRGAVRQFPARPRSTRRRPRWAAIYAALRLFQAMTRQPRFTVERRLKPGDMWAFDNRRVLHARREFDAASGARHLQGRLCRPGRGQLALGGK